MNARRQKYLQMGLAIGCALLLVGSRSNCQPPTFDCLAGGNEQ